MSIENPELQQDLIATAHALADAARIATLRHFRTPGLAADNKLDKGFDPVTVADREAEAAMRKILAARRPDDAILGEEYGRKSGTSGLTWVLDPVDGTRAFLSGTPTWGVLIAVGDATGPRLGVVDQPFIARGNVATAGGCLGSPYLVAWLIARLKGLEAAREVLHYFAPVGEKQAYVERALAHVAPALGAGAALAAVAA